MRAYVITEPGGPDKLACLPTFRTEETMSILSLTYDGDQHATALRIPFQNTVAINLTEAHEPYPYVDTITLAIRIP